MNTHDKEEADDPGSFFFNDTATTEIYTLALHDALPISLSATAAAIQRWRASSPIGRCWSWRSRASSSASAHTIQRRDAPADRKSTRLNSSHANISYAVFCLKKKPSQGIRRDGRPYGATR